MMNQSTLLTAFVYVLVAAFLGSGGVVYAQQAELADQYFYDQAYDKAVDLYQKFWDKPQYNLEAYPKYLEALRQLQDHKTIEKVINQQIKMHPQQASYQLDLAFWLESQNKGNKAEAAYQQAADLALQDERQLSPMIQKLLDQDQAGRAENLLLQARKRSRNEFAYSAELAQVYSAKGNTEGMVNEYINAALENQSNFNLVKAALQDRLSRAEDYELLERVLLSRAQSAPGELIYNELLLWLYIQQKLFERAFIQARAIDKRKRLEGLGLIELGMIAMRNEDYKAAVLAFEYVAKTYPRSPNYAVAKHYAIKAKEEVLKGTYPVTREQITALIQEYELMVNELGRSPNTVPSLRSMALLYAFYLDDRAKAIALLEEAIQLSARNSRLLSECKIDLGDIYLLNNEPWEATLLYSQAEKEQKDSPIAYEAKLKNAKLSYYKGEFVLAKELLDILKMATTREIANDAMELSLLLQDQLFVDTSGLALKGYAAVELLVFQHRYPQALEALNKIAQNYPQHPILAYVFWSKAQIYLRLGQYSEAIKHFELVVERFGDGVLADDAYFLIAQTYERHLKDKTKAMEYYQNHLIRYKGSIYAVEARKRFRILRGDFVN
ncbi:tetratricopeptide repeat protein [Eisenibacter elegans]|jgi:tetratricopeptide (TPR) repeat protein|uniref:tetratricopeptide repeat protein n=1 Tax=Eisenibacter elegans TaxID=997 RepID=UPI0003FE2C95|nr:tetratricopeptide repeat protein [Eisenibacter elegans]